MCTKRETSFLLSWRLGGLWEGGSVWDDTEEFICIVASVGWDVMIGMTGAFACMGFGTTSEGGCE